MTDAVWAGILSGSLGFLAGILLRAPAKYIADKYTDRRREKEAKQRTERAFLDVMKKCPNLIGEMKADLLRSPHVREFSAIKSGTMMGDPRMPRFVYKSNSYPNKAQMLENLGFIVDVTPGNVPMYRMTEEFVELVMEYAPS